MATGWLGAAPPPLGVEPNFEDPPDQLDGNITLHTVCLTLATASLAVRLYTRIKITKINCGIDDCLCFCAFLCSVVFSGLLIECYKWGIGRHMWDTPATWIPHALKYFTISQYFFIPASTLIKLTFLFFYLHIFSTHTMSKYFIHFGIVFTLTSNLALLFTVIFQCRPIERAWNPAIDGQCVSTNILPYFLGGLHFGTDVYILILPMPSLWNLNMRISQKIKLIAVFGLGGFACISSLIRLIKTSVLQSSADVTWNTSQIAVWAVIETNVGIICSSSTLLPAFFDRHWPKAINNSIARMWSHTVSRKTATNEKADGPTLPSARYDSRRTEGKSWTAHDFIELSDVDGETFPKVLHGPSTNDSGTPKTFYQV